MALKSKTHTVQSYKACRVDLHPNDPEYIARGRRLKAFLNCTGLVEELQRPSYKHSEILKKLPSAFDDHISYWFYGNTALVLVEPYRKTLADFKSNDLCAIQIPTSLAPYCGYSSETPGDLPHTNSFLIGLKINKRKLDKLDQLLKQEAPNHPIWHSLK